LAQLNVRNLKQQLEERENDMLVLREEKEKYESEHGKLYSQMTAIRSKSQAFGAQLAKKTIENEQLQERNVTLEAECARLRGIAADEASKQTMRIRTLEAQLRALKAGMDSQADNDVDTQITILRENNEKLRNDLDAAREGYKAELQEILKERETVTIITEDLTRRLEDARTTMLKMSTEKACLLQDIQLLKDERKLSRKDQRDLALSEELQLRLAELETERSNAKTALKKAMAVLDEEESVRRALQEKDEKIAELEGLLKQKLPSMDILDSSLARMSIDKSSSPVIVDEGSPVVEAISVSNLPCKERPAAETNIMARIGEIRSRLVVSSKVDSRFAIPKSKQDQAPSL
jgi:chromosome segregation ATPase